MSVMRIHKNKNFTVMSNFHFKEKKMSLKAKGLLSLMLSLPDDWDYSVSGLAKLSKDGRDSIMAGLSELEKFGYLKRERVKLDNGQFGGIEYNIFEEPQPEKPMLEKSTLENSTLENPILENRTQLNTNSIKNLKNKDIKELSTKGESGLIPDDIYDILINDVKDDELRGLYMDYILMRNTTSPLTAKGLKMLISRGERLSDFNVDINKAIVETAIINNWMNIYAPKQEEQLGRNSRIEERKKFYLGD